MNMVERIQQLPDCTIEMDENFRKLSDALDDYHRLIQEGKLIPRKNTVQDIYTVYSFNSNINM